MDREMYQCLLLGVAGRIRRLRRVYFPALNHVMRGGIHSDTEHGLLTT